MRIYATREDTSERVLIAIKCDVCDAEVKPCPEIAKFGWTRRGGDMGPGTEKYYVDMCPEHGV